MTDTEMREEAERAFSQALAALGGEDTLTALSHLERALKLENRAGWYSYLGYCIAKERGQQRKGLELCLNSQAEEPDNPEHYLNLGRVHLLAGDRVEALRLLREGIHKGDCPAILQLLESLGNRRPPVLPMLSRDNPVNKYLGIIFGRLGLR
jgi:tetratricopeptide (TPR) repeat protein